MKIGPFSLNKIYHRDSVEAIDSIPDTMIDLTVSSPPYDAIRHYNNNVDANFCYADVEYMAYHLFRITKTGGVCVWVCADATIKGSETGTSFKTALEFMRYGWNLHDTMIWVKSHPIPDTSLKGRYIQSFEYMFVFSKGKPTYFNPKLRINIHAGKQFSGNHRKDGNELSDFSHNGKKINRYGIEYNVWKMHNVGNRSGHPAVFPLELAVDHIRTWSTIGSVVFDPFMGSGTTALAAKLEQRNYLGFDLNKTYVTDANAMLRKIKVQNPLKDLLGQELYSKLAKSGIAQTN